MYSWPDVRRILALQLEPFAEVTYQLQPGFHDGIVSGGRPVLHLVQVGGAESGVERTVRVRADVYAAGESAAVDVAEAIASYLVGRPHYVPSDETLGLIDTVGVESVPTPVPYADDVISLVSATYRAVCRPL